ncbi:hypothetical protein MMC24_001491 [Lignoscripta atroalba]|nr:hypothetical protein [Lignoscripta atroalba]
MARPKKGEKNEEKPKDSATLAISMDDFIRTRDSVVTGLATLQSAVQDLSRAYIAHTNTVIGKGPGSSLELLNLANPLGDNGIFGGQRAATPGPPTEVGDGKKPKTRRPHDKNAPKRALTPFFLYMQTARPVLAAAKPKATAKEIADEGTKRWQQMEDEEKAEWQERYAINLARYQEKVKAYKAGLPIPEISDAEARKIYESLKKAGIVHEAPKDVVGPLEEDLATESTSSNGDVDDSPEPPKAPSPPKSPRASKRRKTTKDSAEKASSPAKPSSTKLAEKPTASSESPAVERSSQSPEKERKKKTLKKKGADDASDAKKAAAPASESTPAKASQDNQKKDKKVRKKRKSEAVEEE